MYIRILNFDSYIREYYSAMSFLSQINQLSYKKILSIGLLLALVFTVPMTVLLVQQKTRFASRAAYVKPLPAIEAVLPAPGPVPDEPPEIGRVFPFLGKADDIVFLQGKNFGVNPSVKSLKFSGLPVPDANIEVWENELIQFRIPKGASSGVVELSTGSHPASVSYPFTVYDKNTKLKLSKKGNLVVGTNAGEVHHIKAWLGDDTHVIPVEGEVPAGSGGERSVLDTNGEPVLSIVLYNKAGRILPFYVDPAEWGF